MSAYPPEGNVRVLITPEVMETMVVRDHLGRRLTWEWGEPNEFGDHTPTISVALDDPAPQDIADGQALRLLREALPSDWVMYVRDWSGPRWCVEVWDPYRSSYPPEPPEPWRLEEADTIAEAADACRKALEAR